MLQIPLSNKATASESGGTKLPSGETVTVAYPDRRSRRQRIHLCAQCDFPIAIYGRLIPCEHAFCLNCARSNSICYMCDERIQNIQTIKTVEGIFICAAQYCLKSFLKKTDFVSHVHAVHADLVNSNAQKHGNESEAASAKKPTTSDSTVQTPTPRPVHDGEDHNQRSQPPLRPHMQPKPTPQQMDNSQSRL